MRRVNGIGLGLRHELAEEMLERVPAEIEWVEIHPENYIDRGGKFDDHLARARERWPIVPHGLSLGFGAIEPFDRGYLAKLRAFLDRIEAPWYSDHLCWAGVDSLALHDLLPMPFVRASVELACARIAEVEDAIGRPVAIENVSYYAHPGEPEMSEPDFVIEVLERSGCKLMLDVNNVYVNSRNHGFDPRSYIDRMPRDRVVQMHVAGHLVRPSKPIIDTHAEPICEGVYELLGHALRHTGPVPVLLERDGNYPPLDVLLDELRKLRAVFDEAMVERTRVTTECVR
jgi:uncharacterized protein (UPF0276 family)